MKVVDRIRRRLRFPVVRITVRWTKPMLARCLDLRDEGLTYHEIAAEMRLPVLAVASRLLRCNAKSLNTLRMRAAARRSIAFRLFKKSTLPSQVAECMNVSLTTAYLYFEKYCRLTGRPLPQRESVCRLLVAMLCGRGHDAQTIANIVERRPDTIERILKTHGLQIRKPVREAWNEADWARCLQLLSQGLSFEEAGREFGRSAHAVEMKAWRFRATVRQNKKGRNNPAPSRGLQ